ncbi:MAG: hypothetical protein CSA66_02350 [Proteobacteria bacterium]|nr:MAG: hypothetical protein CSA66_02350 [Pseudomonadota bacterium]
MVDAIQLRGRPDAPARLSDLRSCFFTGRDRLLARLCQAGSVVERAPHAFIYGPAGVGKTALLHELARRLRGAGVEVRWVDGALGATLDAEAVASVLARRGDEAGRRAAVFIDDWERLLRHERLVHAAFERPLSETPVIVIAGEAPPPARWLEAEMARRLELVPLSPMEPHEAMVFLARHGLAASDAFTVAARSYGDPLTLALAADVTRLGGSIALPTEPGRLRLLDALAHQLVTACWDLEQLQCLFAAAWSPRVDADLIGTRGGRSW